MEPYYLAEEFGNIVAKVNETIPVFYLYGHPLEIVQRLQQFSQSPDFKDKQFPLIAYLLDTPVNVGSTTGFYGDARANFIIANYTDPNYTAPERLANNFKPILHPLKDAFVREVGRWRSFTHGGELKYTFIDRYFWGKQGLYNNTGNTFNDYIDAIEIQNLQITIKNKIC